MTSPVVINVLTRVLLADETKGSFVQWSANFNNILINYINMSMYFISRTTWGHNIIRKNNQMKD